MQVAVRAAVPTLPTHERAARLLAGWCSVVAAFVHAHAAPGHFGEWWGYGIVFLIAGFAQGVLGVALLSDAFRADDAAPHAAAWDRRMVLAGIFGNLALISLFLYVRFAGLPVGPEAGDREAFEGVGLAAKALEVVTVVALVHSWRAGRDPSTPASVRQGL